VGPLNLKIEDKEILVLIGPTGSGKTSVLNLIAGLLKPDSGSILVEGEDITSLPVESRRIGYMFQNPSLFPHLNVYDNIVFGLTKKGRKDNYGEIKRLIEDLGISHLTNRYIQGLSGGEMQKISLARMLVAKPKIMLMDEPLAHLDTPTKIKLRIELRRVLTKQGLPTIYVTHFEEDIYALADSLGVLQNGVIEYTAKLESMLSFQNNPSPSFLFDVISAGSNYLEGYVEKSNGGVTTFNIGSHSLEAIGNYPIGCRIAILVRPEDIILSKELLKTSARNVVKAKVANITNFQTGVLNIHLIIEYRFHIISRITEKARTDLQIKKDDYVYAIFKASSPQVVREEYLDDKI
jgi:molybdate transport system ATP-binding protein/molybdate/tungstate transport system ATP-binding protein